MPLDIGSYLWPDAALGRQPRGMPRIDTENSITTALALAVSGTSGINAVTGLPLYARNAAQFGPGIGGNGISWPSTAGTGMQAANTELLTGSAGNYIGGVTILIRANLKSTSGVNFLFAMIGGTYGTYLAANSDQFFSARPGDLSLSATGAGVTATGVIDGNLHTFVLVLQNGTALPLLYVDGVDKSSSQSAVGAFSSSAGRDYIGGYYTSGYAINGGQIFETLAWNRAFTPAEVKSVSANGGQVYAPELGQLWFMGAAGGGGAYTPAIAESVTLADSSSVLATLSASATESISLADSANVANALASGITESMALASTQDAVVGIAANVTESMSLAASASDVAALAASLTEAMNLSDLGSNVASLSASITESMALADSNNASSAGNYTASATESMSLADNVSNVTALTAILTESMSLAGGAINVAALSAGITESMALADSASASTAGNYTASITEGMALADSITNTAALTASVTESIALADQAGNVAALMAAITEAMALADTGAASTSGNYTAAISEALSLADGATVQAALAATLVEAMSLGANAAAPWAVYVAMVEAMALVDSALASLAIGIPPIGKPFVAHQTSRYWSVHQTSRY